ncbi:GTP-Rho binding exocyst subunit [Cladochytrium tenue]|nr:GTP-Rho binding exocyst subunit [Cladochytrium tenue]
MVLFTQQANTAAGTSTLASITSKGIGGKITSDRLRFKLPGSTRKASSGTDALAVDAGDPDEGSGSSFKRAAKGTKVKASNMNIQSLEGRLWPDEALAFLYSGICPVVVRQQNVFVELFSARPEDGTTDAISVLEDLQSIRPKVTDIKVANRLQELCENIFGDLRDLVFPFVEFTLKYDTTFCLGMMVHIEQLIDELKDSAYVYLLSHLELLLSKLSTTFEKFVAEQIKTIEETKLFVDRLESCVAGSSGKARQIVTVAYSQVVKAIFDTLEDVAKDPAVDSKDPNKISEDRDSLNVHILIVGIDELLKTLSPDEISFHMQYSKSALKDVLKKYPGKEIWKGLEQLYKRVERHFTEEAAGLLQVVWRAIQAEYTKHLKRYEELIVLCYPESGLKVEFTIDDLLGYFSELARMH